MRYLYALYTVLAFLILFIPSLPFIYAFGLLGSLGKKCLWYLLKGMAFAWFFLLGMRVRRRFEEPLPPGKRNYIVIANHASYLDTPMIFRCLPFRLRPLATKAFASIPLFGFLYKQMTIMVDRSSAGSRMESVRKLHRALSKGESIFIFPEGRMAASGETLRSFYDGAFQLAVATRTPILPVIFPDTRKRWYPDSFWHWHPGKCHAVFLKIIPARGKTKDELKQIAFARMKQALSAWPL